MKKFPSFLGILIITICVFFGCSKNDSSLHSLNSEGTNQATVNDEVVLYKDQTSLTSVNPKTFILGGNTKKVTLINYNNSILNSLKASAEWRQITKTYTLDYQSVNRIYVHSSPLVSAITIPIKQPNKKEHFVVYIETNKFVITKISETNVNNLTTIKFMTKDNVLYYKFDINSSKQLGNWVFKNEIPFNTTFNPSGKSAPPQEPCLGKSFNDCMNCNIVEVCGSSWACTLTCGLAFVSCAAGSAAACIIFD